MVGDPGSAKGMFILGNSPGVLTCGRERVPSSALSTSKGWISQSVSCTVKF